MNLGRCHDCGQQVRWTRTPKNRNLALDPQPNPHGNVVMVHRDPNGREHVRVLRKGEIEAVPHFMPHAATCPKRQKATG